MLAADYDGDGRRRHGEGVGWGRSLRRQDVLFRGSAPAFSAGIEYVTLIVGGPAVLTSY